MIVRMVNSLRFMVVENKLLGDLLSATSRWSVTFPISHWADMISLLDGTMTVEELFLKQDHTSRSTCYFSRCTLVS